jgi:hypothetical protein
VLHRGTGAVVEEQAATIRPSDAAAAAIPRATPKVFAHERMDFMVDLPEKSLPRSVTILIA